MSDDAFSTTATPSSAGVPRPQGFRFGPGAVLAGRYHVVQPLARGGMGEVYEVEDTELHEKVALKTLDARMAADPVALDRFRGEVKHARRVAHPNVCRMFDFGVHHEGAEAVPFLTMELLAGDTLEEHLKAGRLPQAEAFDILRQVAAALDAAHGESVVHRDLKPSNVMLVRYSGGGQRAVVTDFGIARRVDNKAVTNDGWVGTPSYISPEQLRGDDTGPAADIYALGVMMFEIATGKLPFTGDTALEVAMKRLSQAAPRATSVEPSVPTAWDEAIARCLDRDPKCRPPSAAAAVDAAAGRVTMDVSRTTSRRGALSLGAALVFLAAGGAWLVRSALPKNDRVVLVQVAQAPGATPVAVPEGFPPFNDAVAQVFADNWRAQETARRFRVTTRGEGDLVAQVTWSGAGEAVTASLEVKAKDKVRRRAEATGGSLEAVARALYSELSAVAGDDRPGITLWPEEADAAKHMAAPTPEAYLELMDLARRWDLGETVDGDEQLVQRVNALLTAHPSWHYAAAFKAILLGARSEETLALVKQQLEAHGGAEDVTGRALLERIAQQQAPPLDEVKDPIAAELASQLGPSDERAATYRTFAEQFPERGFWAVYIDNELSEGRLDEAEAELRAWAARAPGQRALWRTARELDVMRRRPVTTLGELLYDLTPAETLLLLRLWQHAGEFTKAEFYAMRLLGTTPFCRAIGQFARAQNAVLRGQLSASVGMLERAWVLAEGRYENSGAEMYRALISREGLRVAEVLNNAPDAQRWRQRLLNNTVEQRWRPHALTPLRYQEAALQTPCPDPQPLIDALSPEDRAEGARAIARAAPRECISCEEVVKAGISATDSSLLRGTVDFAACAAALNRPELGLRALGEPDTGIYLSLRAVDFVLARYWYGRLNEQRGQRAEAARGYQLFLENWGEPDVALPEVDDARARLAAVQAAAE